MCGHVSGENRIVYLTYSMNIDNIADKFHKIDVRRNSVGQIVKETIEIVNRALQFRKLQKSVILYLHIDKLFKQTVPHIN